MSEAVIVQLTMQMMWIVLLLSLPVVVVVASVVGVLVCLLQALTQIQDQTIQFLVKLVAVAVTLAMSYRWMGDVLLNYAGLAFGQIDRMDG